MLTVRADEILTAVVHGARKEEPSTDVQLAAMQALYNSLSFIRDNFEREVRDIIAIFQHQLYGLPDYPRASVITSCRWYARQPKVHPFKCRPWRSSALCEL